MADYVYPLTKMNFVVTVSGLTGTSAFTEITGVESSVDVIEFRQGNSGSLSPKKIPGLVKHGNVTLKYGYVSSDPLRAWILSCVGSTRTSFARKDVYIEMLDISSNTPTADITTTGNSGAKQWILKNAFVSKYSGADLDAKSSDVAIESIEIAYEELTIPTT